MNGQQNLMYKLNHKKMEHMLPYGTMFTGIACGKEGRPWLNSKVTPLGPKFHKFEPWK